MLHIISMRLPHIAIVPRFIPDFRQVSFIFRIPQNEPIVSTVLVDPVIFPRAVIVGGNTVFKQ